jgi:predicted Zn-dependent protease
MYLGSRVVFLRLNIITMKRMLVFSLFGTLILIMGCATNPLTGKSTLALVDNSSIFPSAFQQYDAFLKENKVISGTSDAKLVETVGLKIKLAAEKWLNAIGKPEYLKDYQWEYKLVEDPAVNAWCMPGGKIVVYSGILPVTKDESGLATVMGHEVAHALLNHGQQRMSAGMLQQVGAVGVGVAVGNESQATQEIAMTAYGATTQLGGMLPFSRSHESEADKIGLILMAIAGYNPEASVPFWKRMGEASGGQEPAEFMSTHPSHNTRVSNLTRWIPEAKTEAAKYGVVFK